METANQENLMSTPSAANVPPAQGSEAANLVNPPKETKMVAPAVGGRMIKIIAQREFRMEEMVYDAGGKIIDDQSRMVKKGEMLEVTEKRARELCKEIKGHYAFSGERHNKDGDIKHHDYTMARLATKKDLFNESDEPLTKLD